MTIQKGPANLGTGAIDATELASGSVTADKIGANAVTTAKIADANVTSGKLASGAAVSNIGYTPVNKAGDTMTSKLTIQTSAYGLKLDGTSRSDIELVHTNAGTDLKRRIIRSIDGEFRVGLENDASSSYLNHLNIDSSGRVTKPYQPAFLARGIPQSYTGGTPKYGSSSIPFNIGSHYSQSTGRFTAPIAGKYLFYALGVTNNSSYFYGFFAKNGNAITAFRSSDPTTFSYLQASSMLLIDMVANDYVEISINGGTLHQGSSEESQFGGYLVG
jgi:hypothetical protein